VLLLLALLTQAEEKRKVAPLFTVALEHEFPDAAAAFEEARGLLLEHYYSSSLTEEALYWAAIEGMLRHISPPGNPELGKIWQPADYSKVRDSLKGVKVSVGIKSSFNQKDGSLTVTGVEPTSPADGLLQANDRIMRIDDQPLSGKSVSDVNSLLQGEIGTKVSLKIIRDIKIFEVQLERSEFHTQQFVCLPVDAKIWLCELRTITATTSADVAEQLALAREANVTGLVLDLRNNVGGVFLEALRTVELFLGEKTVMLRTLKKADNLQNYVSTTEEPYDFDIAILANENTASSAEIIVAGLQDAGATVVGKKTYGKGVFEQTFALENKFRLKFIIGTMYSPKGKSWQSKGILPDYAVDQKPAVVKTLRQLPVSQRLSKDVSLITAVKLLRRSHN